MKCQNNIVEKGDLVYWFDPWKNKCGIGIVICFKSLWLEILTDRSYVDFIITPTVNVNKVTDYSSIEDFFYSKKNF